ncbi:MAG: hypothetical protein EXQ88_01525 [Alphaproteobacteria bacterium]|nr:hypothetical protein [Alphaproteobacteria bacterium]
MRWDQFAEQEVEVGGKRRRVWALSIAQAKTGARVAVPVHERLLEALLAAKAAAEGMTIVARANGRPAGAGGIVKAWGLAKAAAGMQASSLQRRDLRRTAVVRLAEAGATVPQIAAVSGHSIQQTTAILETYLPRSATMATGGITRLEAHMREREKTKE